MATITGIHGNMDAHNCRILVRSMTSCVLLRNGRHHENSFNMIRTITLQQSNDPTGTHLGLDCALDRLSVCCRWPWKVLNACTYAINPARQAPICPSISVPGGDPHTTQWLACSNFCEQTQWRISGWRDLSESRPSSKSCSYSTEPSITHSLYTGLFAHNIRDSSWLPLFRETGERGELQLQCSVMPSSLVASQLVKASTTGRRRGLQVNGCGVVLFFLYCMWLWFVSINNLAHPTPDH
jgi:hypothetical protein